MNKDNHIMVQSSIDLFGVVGRIALVTGGGSGIGFMISQGLVENGCKVYICGLNSDEIEEKAKQLNTLAASSGSQGTAIGFEGDVASKEGISAIATFVTARETHLDILISNAGIRRDAPIPCDVLSASLEDLQASLWSHSYSDWEETFRVNTSAHYFLSVALLPLLAAAADLDLGDGKKGRDDGRGVVVVTSSCASMHNCTNVDLMSYATSKAATDHLVAMLAAKFGRWYVRVCAINPGFVPTKMNVVGEEGNMFANLIDKVPAKRVGRMEDMAGTVIYLCSKAGSYVDGVCLCLDGGRTLVANGQE
ncbi:7-alpha-hydroxysteroid dehydrogenase [Xylariaceae sp. FL0016]|nr:7-alpha-hydroxysteroid dehydrogenase [Xylariaceae sp. FL0016]